MASGRFRKKPVEVDAWQYLDHVSMPKWLREACDVGAFNNSIEGAAIIQADHQEGPRITIVTKEGSIFARPGDWIIRGTHGELYPCKPEIFAEIYEPAS